MDRKNIIFICIALLSFFSSTKVIAQNQCSCWQPIDTGYHVVPFQGATPPDYRNDDGSSPPIVLPFTFCFYGASIDTVYINTNGNISFYQSYSAYSPNPFPLSGYSMLAPFWADVDTRAPQSGTVYYKITPTYMVVQWDTVGYYGAHADLRNTFQVIMSNGSDPIIPNGNNVEFCYQVASKNDTAPAMQWTTGDASHGQNGFDRPTAPFHPATVGANKGDALSYLQFGLFGGPGNAYFGQYPPSNPYDGVSWLDNQTFIFSTCSNNIPPIVSGITSCDTIIECMGDTSKLTILFLCPKNGDTANSALKAPLVPGVSIFRNVPGTTDSLTLQIIASGANYGFHTIHLFGWISNVNPHDTSFVNVVLEVDSSAVGHIVASKDTICLGDSVKLKAISNVQKFKWSTNQTTDSIEVKPAVTTTYSLQIAKGKCDLNLTQTIVVVTSAKLQISKDTVCKGDSTVLTVIDGTSYKWSTGATTSSIRVKINNDSTIKCVAKCLCGTDSLSGLIHMVLAPSVTISGKDSICTGGNTVITVTGGKSYTWTPATGLSCNNCPNPTASPTVTTTYTIAASNGYCSKDTTATVYVIPFPVPSISPNPDSACAGQQIVLTGSGGGTYKWSTGGTYDTVQVRDGGYTLTVTKNGCSASVSENVALKSKVPVSTILSKNNICPYDSTTITARGGSAYKWQPGGSTDSIIHILPGFTRTYTVAITTPCGMDTLKQLVNVLPYPNIQTSPDTIICKLTSANIRISGGTSYSWTPSSTLTCNTCPNPIASPTVTTTYTVTVTGANGCSKDTTIKVTVATKDGVVTPPQTACTGKDVILTASGGGTYKWSTGATTSTISVIATSNSSYTVIVSNGCPDTLQTSISVHPPPVVTAFFANGRQTDSINKGDTAWMFANSSINNYSWTPIFDLSCSACPNPMATPTVTTTYTVTSDSAGCNTERTLTVYVEVPCADFKVPNVFTPNNDGRNDDFVVNVLNPTSYSIQIFDRWGKEVYTSTNPTAYWTGHILSTQDMVPDGVYFYTIKASCGSSSYVKQGFVEVLTGGSK